jgi:hypothetical protein
VGSEIGVKLKDIRPCDSCRGPVGDVFHVVRFSIAVVDAGALSRNAAMATLFRVPMLSGITEVFAPTDAAITLLAEQKDGPGWDERLLCNECFARLLGIVAEERVPA